MSVATFARFRPTTGDFYMAIDTEVVVALEQRLEVEGVGQRCRQEESGIRYRMGIV